MRIAVWHNLPSGGGKRALYDHVRELLARGHKIEAWCPPSADRGYLPLRDLVPEHVVPLGFNAKTAVGRFFQKADVFGWNTRFQVAAMNRHSRECARQIEDKGFDLLFAACCILFHTPMIARFLKLPKVVYLQEANRPLYEASPELPWPATPWARSDLFELEFWRKAVGRRLRLSGVRVLAREELISAKAFDTVLVNSFYSRESVLRAFGLDSKVCYLGVDTKKFYNQHREREGFVVCVAALVPNKNIELLIRSLAEIPALRRPKLVLICNMIFQPYLESIRQLGRDCGVQFEVRQRIPDAEVMDLLNRASMMVYAPRLEPFGYAPLEANACGLPVVAVAEGGVRETVQHEINGLLVDHDPRSMARAITRLLGDEELRCRLSRGAEQVARAKWSLEASIDRLENALNAGLNGSHAEMPEHEISLVAS